MERPMLRRNNSSVSDSSRTKAKNSCLSRRVRAARWLPSITGIPHPLGKVAMMPGPRAGGR